MLSSRFFFFLSAILAAVALSTGAMLAGSPTVAILAVALAGLWLSPELLPASGWRDRLRSGWVSNACLGTFTLFALWLELVDQPWPLAVGVLAAALAAWDLFAFRRRVYWQERALGGAVLRAYHAPGARMADGNTPEPGAAYPLAYPESDTPAGAAGEEDETQLPAQAAVVASAAANAALERSHLRALGAVILAGVGCAALLYLLAGAVELRLGLAAALGLGLGLVIALIVLVRVVNRS
jgi:hypothetical protein